MEHSLEDDGPFRLKHLGQLPPRRLSDVCVSHTMWVPNLLFVSLSLTYTAPTHTKGGESGRTRHAKGLQRRADQLAVCPHSFLGGDKMGEGTQHPVALAPASEHILHIYDICIPGHSTSNELERPDVTHSSKSLSLYMQKFLA